MRCPNCHRRLAQGTSCPDHPDVRAPAAPDAAELPAIDGFAIVKSLGGGGFAQVFAARTVEAGTEVAIKVALRPGDKRLGREGSVLRLLGPPMGPSYLGEGTTAAGLPYLVMEQVRGRLLADWLTDRAQAPSRLEQVATIVDRFADTVDRMHARGILHRDLKPENAFVCGDEPHITLIDFGLACRLGAPDDAPDAAMTGLDLTATGALAGTPMYMAPEQCRGQCEPDRRTDLYALGVILFEALCGRPPFVGEAAEIEVGHTTRRPPRLSEYLDLGSAVDQVLARALAKEPAQRFSSATEMATALRAALAAATREPAARLEPAAPAAQPAKVMARAGALLALRSDVPLTRIAALCASQGGHVARASGDLYVVAFPEAASAEAGVGMALRAAESLEEAATTCVIHVAEMRVRASGQRVTVISRALEAADTWAPRDAAAHDVRTLLTAEAAGVLAPGLTARLEGTGFHALKQVAGAAATSGATELVGREQVVEAMLADGVAALTEGVATLTTLRGEVGYGKTRVLEAVAQALADRGYEVARLAAGHPDSNMPDVLLKDLLRFAFRLPPGPVSGEEIWDACLACLPAEDVEAAFGPISLSFAAIDPTDPVIAGLLKAPGALRQLLARFAAAALVRRASVRPLAVFVDDAHWADPTSLDVLEVTTMTEADAPVWVCVAAQPQLTETRATWGSRARRATSHELEPLREEATRRLLKELLRPAEYIPDSVLVRLQRTTGGVPLYVVDTVHALHVSGAIQPRQGTSTWVLAADDILKVSATPLAERLTARTLEALPAAHRELAQLCAVLGDPIEIQDVDGVQQLLSQGGGRDLDPTVALSRLERVGVLRRRSETSFGFRSPMLREGIESLTPAAVRRTLHDAARRFIAADPNRRAAALARFARHAAASGARDEAAAAFSQLAAAAVARHRYTEAEDFYTAALVHLDEARRAEREAALTGRGMMRYRIWKIAEARGDFDAALLLAEERGEARAIVNLLLEQATIRDWSYEFPATAAVVARAVTLAEGLDDPLIRARLLFAVGRCHFREERLSQACDVLTASASLARELGEHELRVLSLLLLGPALVLSDRLAEAEERFAEVVALCEEANDRLHLGAAFLNRMSLWTERADYDRALADARQSTKVAREVGHVQLERLTTYNTAELLFWAGKDLDEALRDAQHAGALQRFCTCAMPEVPLLIARLHGARVEHDAARQIVEGIRRDFLPEQLMGSKQVLVRMVELACAPQFSGEDWSAVLAEARTHSVQDERLEVLLAGATAALRAGALGMAARCIVEGRELARDADAWHGRFARLERQIPEGLVAPLPPDVERAAPPPMDERRGKPRTAIFLPVTLILGDQRVVAELRDLSETGALVRAPQGAPRGADVGLSVSFRDADVCEGRATVVRSEGSGALGLSFSALDAKLQAFVRLVTGARATSEDGGD